ncbi:MAG: hypothetical protein HY705_00420 [Gemmatimonadetes bacterium]|nr:hypothetical protein [Gemmatimonadota bacterium]
MRAILAIAVAFLLWSTHAAVAQDVKSGGDPRVRKLLDQLEFKYEVDEDGDYSLVFDVGSSAKKRTQLAYVGSKTEQFGDFEIREVWSPAFLVEGPIAQDLANRLLVESGNHKLGAWQTLALEDGRHVVIYVVKLFELDDPEMLRLALNAALEAADEMEESITGEDKY